MCRGAEEWQVPLARPYLSSSLLLVCCSARARRSLVETADFPSAKTVILIYHLMARFFEDVTLFLRAKICYTCTIEPRGGVMSVSVQ